VKRAKFTYENLEFSYLEFLLVNFAPKRMLISPDWIKIFARNSVGSYNTDIRRRPSDQKSKPEVNSHDVSKRTLGIKVQKYDRLWETICTKFGTKLKHQAAIALKHAKFICYANPRWTELSFGKCEMWTLEYITSWWAYLELSCSHCCPRF